MRTLDFQSPPSENETTFTVTSAFADVETPNTILLTLSAAVATAGSGLGFLWTDQTGLRYNSTSAAIVSATQIELTGTAFGSMGNPPSLLSYAASGARPASTGAIELANFSGFGVTY